MKKSTQGSTIFRTVFSMIVGWSQKVTQLLLSKEQTNVLLVDGEIEIVGGGADQALQQMQSIPKLSLTISIITLTGSSGL
jgi:hypothetical protein